ncbi:MAG: hypothetical protein HY812_13350 [Planctomycetes bacterium]|nr:hypothetical protein [Planctomycetota bacterium]
MKCAEFREQVVHVVLGQADAGIEAAARAHARQCAACGRELEQVAVVARLLRGMEAQPASASFRPRLAERLRAERAEEESLLQSATFADRTAARFAYVAHRLRSSRGLRVLLTAAALHLVGLGVYLLWSVERAAAPVLTETAHLPAPPAEPGAGGGEPAVVPPLPESAPVSVQDLANLTPPSPDDVIEPPQFPLPAYEEALDPLPSEVVDQVLKNTVRDNSLALSRFRMRHRFSAPAGGAADRAVGRGLRWLAERQQEDGSWNPALYGGGAEARVGSSALCVLALLGSAERGRPGGPEWRHVERGLAYLRSQVTADRTIGAVRGDEDVVLFNHAVATLALIENYVLGGRQDEKLIADALERLADLGARRRFRERQKADNITAPWVALALETARASGAPAVFDLARAADDAQDFVARLVDVDPRTGRALVPGSQLCAIACAAALDPLFDDVRDWEHYEPPVDLLLQHLHEPSLREPTKIFFAAVDVHQRGGVDWERWHADAARILPEEQDADGGFKSEYQWDPVGSMGGALYETALAVLTLSVPRRLAR